MNDEESVELLLSFSPYFIQVLLFPKLNKNKTPNLESPLRIQYKFINKYFAHWRFTIYYIMYN